MKNNMYINKICIEYIFDKCLRKLQLVSAASHHRFTIVIYFLNEYSNFLN